MSVHSHAVAPESSGAFFLDMVTERCVFQAGGLRNALRASAAVHATGVMVNPQLSCLDNLCTNFAFSSSH